MPDVDDEVLVVFLQGDPRYPLVLGGLWNGANAAPASIGAAGNTLKRIRSKNGIQITLDDQQGQETLTLETPGGQKLTLKDGPGRGHDRGLRTATASSSRCAGITVQAASTVKVQAAKVDVTRRHGERRRRDGEVLRHREVRSAADRPRWCRPATRRAPATSGDEMKPHAILLRAPGEIVPASTSPPAGTAGAPAILQRSDDDFVDATLEDLRSGAGRAGLAASLAATRGRWRAQAVPADAAAVSRRAARGRAATCRARRASIRRASSRPAWCCAGSGQAAPRAKAGCAPAGRLRGWVAIDAEIERDDRHDPLPADRLARKAVGPPGTRPRARRPMRRKRPAALLAEHVIPLFLAPPDVCAEAGKTLYYGIVPTTSSDLSEAPGEMPEGFRGRQRRVSRSSGGAAGRGSDDPAGRAASPVMQAWRDQADIPPGTSGHDPLVTQVRADAAPARDRVRRVR